MAGKRVGKGEKKGTEWRGTGYVSLQHTRLSKEENYFFPFFQGRPQVGVVES